MEVLIKQSKFNRPDANDPNIIERNGERFEIKRAASGSDPILSKALERMEAYFGSEEVDPEDVVRRAVDGNKRWDDADGNPIPDITKYSINVVSDNSGEPLALFTGGRVDIFDDSNKPTGKQVFIVGYAMTNIRHLTMVDEAYTAAVLQAARGAEAEGKKLSFIVGETNPLAEAASNRVGMQMVYAEDPEKPGSYKQLEYEQPALDFNKETGEVEEDAGIAREMLAIGTFENAPLQKEDVRQIVRSIYTWNNKWPREAFASDEAWNKHKAHVEGVWNKFNEHLQSLGEVVLFDKATHKQLEKEGRIVGEKQEEEGDKHRGQVQNETIAPLSQARFDKAA